LGLKSNFPFSSAFLDERCEKGSLPFTFFLFHPHFFSFSPSRLCIDEKKIREMCCADDEIKRLLKPLCLLKIAVLLVECATGRQGAEA
jgi:hypothetical protein